MNNSNYDWLIKDISNSIIINLFYCENDNETLYDSYDVLSLLDVVNEPVNIKFANIDDITNLLTINKIRFISPKNPQDIIDVPVRNIYKLYKNATYIDKIGKEEKKLISTSDLDAFVIADGASVKDGFFIEIIQIRQESEQLKEFIEITKDFGNMGMQEKFDALSSTNNLNYRRVKTDNL